MKTSASECERQIDFVHNLLDLSRIQAGGVQINLSRVDAGEVLRICEKIERVAAAERNHVLTLEIAEDLPDVCADSDALRRALCTIAENAIKYTPEGGRIRMRAGRDNNGDDVVIEIADNGRGIHAQDVPHIFERFYRGKAIGESRSADSQEVSGIGLGLYLARELVEGMNGKISARSRLGAGSTFTVRIPVWRESENASEHLLNPAAGNFSGSAEKTEEIENGSKTTGG